MSENVVAKPNMALMHLHRGAVFRHQDRDYVILAMSDISTMLCREVASGAKVLIKVGDVKPPTSADIITSHTTHASTHDPIEVTEQQWEEAKRRLQLMSQLLAGNRSRRDYDEVARQSGTSRPTLYRWMNSYRETGLLTSLVPNRRPGGRGVGRLPEDVEAIIGAVVRDFYLTTQKPSKVATIKEVQRKCRNAQLPIPHALTIRKRMEWISGLERLEKREGTYAAQMKFEPDKGKIPDAEWPLAMVEMDHTLLPIIVVSETTRQPIGRPWITLAIDVKTRVVVGMFMSMEAPSAMAAGMCIAHAILPKEDWMRARGVSVEWPIWGVMDNLHMDNAKELHGEMIKANAHDYGFIVHRRPVKKPHYGAHIERLMGTMSQKLKVVGGATFSGPKEKGVYDAEGKAILTYQEAEQWVILAIAEYHNEVHSQLGTTPLQCLREELLGLNGKAPRGIPARRTDSEKVRIDFMPFDMRTVQTSGVQSNELHYYHDVLRPWINVPDEENPKKSKKYRFRYDPRDISRLYFFDPDLKAYHAIPYRDSSRPPISIWELRAAKKIAKQQKLPAGDENTLFEIINNKRELIENATEKTKAARRARDRQKAHERARKETSKQLPKAQKIMPSELPPSIPGYDADLVEAFPDE
jgi:putative transposase